MMVLVLVKIKSSAFAESHKLLLHTGRQRGLGPSNQVPVAIVHGIPQCVFSSTISLRKFLTSWAPPCPSFATT